MLRYGLILVLTATMMGWAAVGCKRKQPTPPPPSTPAGQEQRPHAEGQTTPPPVQTPTPPPPSSLPAAPPVVAPPSPPTAAPAGMSTTEAQSMLDQSMQYIRDKKYDLADSTLRQLEANQASLPESFRPQIAHARTLLNAARTSGGGIPSLPGGLNK